MFKPLATAIMCAASLSVFAGSQPAWFDQAVDSEFDKMVEMRIKLHQMPELGNQEAKTQEVIYNFLKSVGIDKVIKGYKGSPTAVVGILNPNKGDTVGLRADIDGLPIKENTGLSYASKAKGKMWWIREPKNVRESPSAERDFPQKCLKSALSNERRSPEKRTRVAFNRTKDYKFQKISFKRTTVALNKTRVAVC